MTTILIPLGVLRPRKPTNQFAIIDGCYWAAVMKHGWSVNAKRYAGARINKKLVLLHRFIFNLAGIIVPAGMDIDHIDRNPLNNMLANLRILNRSVNGANCGLKKNNTSGFRNVSFDKREGKWHAYVKKNRKRHSFGYHLTAIEAAIAANRAFLIHFPELPAPNIIP